MLNWSWSTCRKRQDHGKRAEQGLINQRELYIGWHGRSNSQKGRCRKFLCQPSKRRQFWANEARGRAGGTRALESDRWNLRQSRTHSWELSETRLLEGSLPNTINKTASAVAVLAYTVRGRSQRALFWRQKHAASCVCEHVGAWGLGGSSAAVWNPQARYRKYLQVTHSMESTMDVHIKVYGFLV